MLRKIFARRGFEVASAWTVAEGLAAVDARPAFLILDLMLPDGDGLAILRKIRDDRLPIRVVVASGVGDPGWLVEVAALRPEGHLTKPIDALALLRLVASDTMPGAAT